MSGTCQLGKEIITIIIVAEPEATCSFITGFIISKCISTEKAIALVIHHGREVASEWCSFHSFLRSWGWCLEQTATLFLLLMCWAPRTHV